MCISVMTPFSLRDSNQRPACARSVRVSPHVCCQVYKEQVSVSNIVVDATGSRVHTTSIHKYPVSCHVPRCSIPSQHISPLMRPNELPKKTISINRKRSERLKSEQKSVNKYERVLYIYIGLKKLNELTRLKK